MSEAQSYTNLKTLYNEHQYDSRCIWNIDKSRYQAFQYGFAKVFAKRGLKGVHKIIPAERKWLNVLSTINASKGTIPNYYFFKDVRNYVAYCEPTNHVY